jgi:hypothetical protein
MAGRSRFALARQSHDAVLDPSMRALDGKGYGCLRGRLRCVFAGTAVEARMRVRGAFELHPSAGRAHHHHPSREARRGRAGIAECDCNRGRAHSITFPNCLRRIEAGRSTPSRARAVRPRAPCEGEAGASPNAPPASRLRCADRTRRIGGRKSAARVATIAAIRTSRKTTSGVLDARSKRIHERGEQGCEQDHSGDHGREQERCD